MKDTNEENRRTFISLIKKMEKIDRDMREMKEALLVLKERVLNDQQFTELQTTHQTGESDTDG